MGIGYLLHFSHFYISFRGIQTHQRYKLSFIFSNQTKKKKKGTKHRKRKNTIRKDDLNQLLVNKINALQTEQSNWGGKKSFFFFLFLFFVNINACAALPSFSKLCSSHFVTSRSVLPKMSWWQNHNSQSLKDKFNTLSGKLNHNLDRILR